MRHELKTDPVYWEAVQKGLKLFEIRRNDRNYQVGDTLILREYDAGKYTGAQLHMKVIYILQDDRFLQPGYVCMSIAFLWDR